MKTHVQVEQGQGLMIPDQTRPSIVGSPLRSSGRCPAPVSSAIETVRSSLRCAA